MITLGLIPILLLSGLLSWIAGRYHAELPRWVALVGLAFCLLFLLSVWSGTSSAGLSLTGGGPWLEQIRLDWIPRFGISLHLGLDGLSLALCLLTVFLGLMAVSASWNEIRERTGFFYLNLLWTLAGAIGVFLALDLFLFFLFWELMLVPMYFVIALWGHGESGRAALKFFLFTQGSGLLLLVGLLVLVLGHQATTGTLTFDYFDLRDASIDPNLAFWAMLGFFLAFTVKLPMVPLHTWLPEAHTLAPTGGSVILAGVLLKTGGYGLIRFLVPLFPDAAATFAPVALGLAVVSILYGALLAFAQTDIKRLIAYSSVSHMGFVLLGVFAWNTLALQGAVIQMLAHGVSAAALFMLAGSLRERLHTLDSTRMGGLWAQMPRLSALALFFAVATLGLPGLGNFVGEILVLLGTFRDHPLPALIAIAGIVTAAIYALALVQRVFHGPPRDQVDVRDTGIRETAVLGVMVVALLALGLYPQPVLDLVTPPLSALTGARGG
jgi:NADH-quinone oxidoreductase subunit M